MVMVIAESGMHMLLGSDQCTRGAKQMSTNGSRSQRGKTASNFSFRGENEQLRFVIQKSRPGADNIGEMFW